MSRVSEEDEVAKKLDVMKHVGQTAKQRYTGSTFRKLYVHSVALPPSSSHQQGLHSSQEPCLLLLSILYFLLVLDFAELVSSLILAALSTHADWTYTLGRHINTPKAESTPFPWLFSSDTHISMKWTQTKNMMRTLTRSCVCAQCAQLHLRLPSLYGQKRAQINGGL